MQHLLELLTSAAAAHPDRALALVTLVAFAESLAIVGTVVPAAVVMFAAGALVGHRSLGLAPTLACAAMGAIAGDALSYELGRAQQQRMRAWRAFRRHAQAIQRAEAFIQRHGAASVVLARFTGAVRAFVPLLAGFAHMPRGRFYLTNVVSALLWAPAHILPGVVFGTSLQLAEAASGRLVVLLLAVALVLWTAVWITTHALRWIVPQATRLRDWLVHRAKSRETRLARITLALLDPARHGSRALLAGLALLVASMWLFLGVIEDILSNDALVIADRAVFTFLQQLRTDAGDRAMVAITEMGSVGVMLPLIAAVLAWLLWHRSWRTAGYWLGIVASAELLVQVLKWTLGRHRPLQLYQGVEQFSFPSGHATVSAVVLGFLAFLLTRGQGARWRLAVAIGAALYVSLVAFSRLYLGAHWLSDVVGGMSFGLAWVSFVAMVYTHRGVREPLAVRHMAMLAVATIAIAAGLWISWRGAADLRRYSVRIEPQTMTQAAWLDGGWRTLPQRRREFAGEEKEALPLQWACDGPAMDRALAAAGWKPVPALSMATALRSLAPQTALQDLPALPKFDGGRASSLVMARPSDNKNAREVLRFWRSNLVVASSRDAPVRVWYGAASLQERSGPRGLWVRETAMDAGSVAQDLAREGNTLVRLAAASTAQSLPRLLACDGRR